MDRPIPFSRVVRSSFLQKDWDGNLGRSVGSFSLEHRWCSSKMILCDSEHAPVAIGYLQSALPQRGGEVNLTLGGIDLNSSGSVVVREDKKLLTVLFPDGRDGRAFTLKAETSEDLYEWKAALELALAQAPSADLMGNNGIFRNDMNDTVDGLFHQWRGDKRPVKSLVVGRPILLALEDIDGGPSFLEKALRFLEKFGTKVEGILRLSADVEEVDRRVQEYEQGKTEFDADEDAHIVGDCVKHVLRELPSSPVPSSCCTALLEAYKIDRKEARVNAMRAAIVETFPEPNRRLLQRILKMMHTISSHASENRMNASAVAACMAPLLLRPLLAGECELEDDFDFVGDNSAQLLAAANAANNAQAIVTILLEEYENIFDDENHNRCSISADSQIENSGSEDSTDDEQMDIKDNGFHGAENEVYHESDDDDGDNPQHALSGKLSDSGGHVGCDLYDYKAFGYSDLYAGQNGYSHLSVAPTSNVCDESRLARASNMQPLEPQSNGNKVSAKEINISSALLCSDPQRSMGEILSSMDPTVVSSGTELSTEKVINKPANSTINSNRSSFWGRGSSRKTLSMESIDSSGEEELAIQRLEIAKNDLRHRIAKEARGNAILQASLERRKQALHERRLALEQDVSRLQEQLQAERDLRAALEVGLSMSSERFSSSRGMDSKTRAELEEIALAEADVARLKQKVAELHHQLNQQRQHHYGAFSDLHGQYTHVQNSKPQQKFLPQDFDTTLAHVNHERKQRTEESSISTDWRNIKGQVSTPSNGKHLPRKQALDYMNTIDSRSTADELCGNDSGSVLSSSRFVETLDYHRHPSSALVELTTRLDFFKERRSQLMEQLQHLDLNYGSSSAQDFAYRPSSPPWN
uniref:Rho-GAP domain-containing protein n=1 Tax=Kalanchoe fedtschenkoi TaxID=63787 RepID=A0A7N0UEZ9_KALFE